jgi:hypothetical protein
MSDNRTLFVEEAIIGTAKRLLTGRVNEILETAQFSMPPIEFSDYTNGFCISPVVSLSSCERTEKERIIRLDVYTLTIAFAVPESPDGELFCYAYADAVDRALREDPALGGVASRATLIGKKYVPPKQSGTGGDWEAVLTLRIAIEGGGYAD